MEYNLYIINGPNLNLLGKRQPEIYGKMSFDEYYHTLQKQYEEIDLHYFQSNHEGEIIDFLHDIGFQPNTSAVMNPGGLSHYSVSLLDAIYAVEIPVVEVHISNPMEREIYRQNMLTSQACVACFAGKGLESYNLAIQYLIDKNLKQ